MLGQFVQFSSRPRFRARRPIWQKFRGSIQSTRARVGGLAIGLVESSHLLGGRLGRVARVEDECRGFEDGGSAHVGHEVVGLGRRAEVSTLVSRYKLLLFGRVHPIILKGSGVV